MESLSAQEQLRRAQEELAHRDLNDEVDTITAAVRSWKYRYQGDMSYPEAAKYNELYASSHQAPSRLDLSRLEAE